MLQIFGKLSDRHDWELITVCDPEDHHTFAHIMYNVERLYEHVMIQTPNGDSFTPHTYRPVNATLH